jgi:hypothetical protein
MFAVENSVAVVETAIPSAATANTSYKQFVHTYHTW